MFLVCFLDLFSRWTAEMGTDDFHRAETSSNIATEIPLVSVAGEQLSISLEGLIENTQISVQARTETSDIDLRYQTLP